MPAASFRIMKASFRKRYLGSSGMMKLPSLIRTAAKGWRLHSCHTRLRAFYALSARVGANDDCDDRFTDRYEQRLLDLRGNVDASNREFVWILMERARQRRKEK